MSLPLVSLDDEKLRTLLAESRRIAVLGIKPDSYAERPAHFVPRYLAEVGYDVIPVPVYYPDVKAILGRPVYRSLSAIPGSLDIVNVFRRPEHVMQHLAELLNCRPRVVWMQSGIRHDEAAARLTDAGIVVVQDRCLMVDHLRLLGAAT